MISSGITQIQKTLNNPATAARLLPGPADGVLVMGGLRWSRLPLFYGSPYPRASYKVETYAGSTWFVKLNVDTAHILTERRICQIMMDYPNLPFYVPELLAWSLDAQRDSGEKFGWLAQVWVDGAKVDLARAGEIDRIAEALSALHEIVPDYDRLSQLFGVTLPSPDEIARLEHEHQLHDIRTTLPLASARLRHSLEAIEAGLQESPPDILLRMVHGDFHLYNLMLDPRGRMVFFDWEDAHIDHPMNDVGHMFERESNPMGMAFVWAYMRASRTWMAKEAQASLHEALMRFAAIWLARALKWSFRDPGLDDARRAALDHRAVEVLDWIKTLELDL